MIIGFIIRSLICALLFGVGIWTWNAKKPAGFFAGVEPPAVKDARKYNNSVATLWFLYARLMEALGIPFLFLEQNSVGFLAGRAGSRCADNRLHDRIHAYRKQVQEIITYQTERSTKTGQGLSVPALYDCV